MGEKRQKNQLELAFTAERKGEARTPDRKGTESSMARYESERLAERLNPPNRRVRTRMHGGVGGGGP